MTHEVADGLFPLSGWDEYPIHQTVAPVRYVATTDPRAFERYWFTAAPKDGRFLVVVGMGFCPNLGVQDAYALLVRDGRQVTVRAQIPLPTDRAVMRVGPIVAEPVRPFGEWKLTIADNDQNLKGELRWCDTKRAAFRKLDVAKMPGFRPGAHLLHDWGGYEAFGTVEGWIEFAGQRLELSPQECSGSRDHHWGTRDGVGGLSIAAKSGGTHCGQFVEFTDWAIWVDQILFDVDSEKRPVFAEATDHRVAFDPVTRHFTEAVITNKLSNGETRVLHYRHIPGATAYLRCAGYTGSDGRGTPVGDHHHGQDLGGAVSGEVFDVGDERVRTEIAGFEDQLCVVECDGETTVGILECGNPALYEMCARGIPGFSFLERG